MNILVLLAMLFTPLFAIASDDGIKDLTAHGIFDNRTTLNLTVRMQHRLLSNMRRQMAATQAIIGLIAEQKFDKASKIAGTRLKMTEDLKPIYDTNQNDNFKNLMLTAHASADELAKVLRIKSQEKSLQALRKTMGYCIQCHNEFRQ